MPKHPLHLGQHFGQRTVALASIVACALALTTAGNFARPDRRYVWPSSTSDRCAYRASKMIGSTVTNDSKEKIGSIDDLLITLNDRVLFAVL